MEALILNGPMGVGKTTLGKYIADRFSGTAFIDGDWCMDLHPFVGSRETKEMAIDNILHMVNNYSKCTVCRRIVMVWLMDDAWVREHLLQGIASLGLQAKCVTLTCDEETLCSRWENDKLCEWRTDDWLQISLKSLPYFSSLPDAMEQLEKLLSAKRDRED